MSDIMFSDPKHRVDWRTIVTHDDKQVKGFFGDYRFLSNFASCEVWYEGVRYDSTESAYQAAKVMPEYRPEFSRLSPAASKKGWKEFPLMDKTPDDWEGRKFSVMMEANLQKYLRNVELRDRLSKTGDRYLEETNWWRDEYWGVDYKTKKGKNMLGKVLMNIRTCMREFEKAQDDQSLFRQQFLLD